MLNICCY